MRMLLAFDGSGSAQVAIRDLRNAGLPVDLEVRVLTVGADRLSAEDTARQAAATLAERFPAWRVAATAVAGEPAAEILKWAEADEADLIVLGAGGTHGRGLGGTARRVVQNARCTVRVVHHRIARHRRPLKILLGFDGSPGADAALRALALRRWPSPPRARVVLALEPLVRARLAHHAALTSHDRAHEGALVARFLESSLGLLRRAGVTIGTLAVDANPKRLILAQAAAWGADCIFLGAQGLRRLEPFLPGEVAAAVAAAATCPVEIVRERT